MTTPLTPSEKRILLRLAREAIDLTAHGQPLPPLDSIPLPERLRQAGTSFITLTRDNHLRGCVGGIEVGMALAADVREHAIAAAFRDYRFPPVQTEELQELEVEVSVLTPPEPLSYDGPDDLLHKLRPGVDGVIITDGVRRATFLPQVWEKIPEPTDFLNMLCEKMGTPSDTWRAGELWVKTYQVEKFTEGEFEE